MKTEAVYNLTFPAVVIGPIIVMMSLHYIPLTMGMVVIGLMIVSVASLFYARLPLYIRSRPEITFTSSRFSRTPLCLPVRYIPSGMRLSGNSQNHLGIFRETCKVYFLTAPMEKHFFRIGPGGLDQKHRKWYFFSYLCLTIAIFILILLLIVLKDKQ